MNILIADDDKIFSFQLEAMLEELKYRVVGRASTFQQVLDFLNIHHVDLVLIDLVLEGKKDGMDLAKELIQRNIPFIFMTAYDSREFYQRALAFEEFQYLIKPIHIYTLDSAIRLIIRRKQQPPQFIKVTAHGQIIAVKDIIYIEVERTYSFIQTTTKRFAFKISLNLLKQQLPLDNFIQIHRSFLVQKSFIKRINFEKNIVELENYTLPISRRMKHELLQYPI